MVTQIVSAAALSLGLLLGLWRFRGGRGGGLLRDQTLWWRVGLLALLYGGNTTFDLVGIMKMPVAVVKVIRTPKPLYTDILMLVCHGVRSPPEQVAAIALTVVGAGMTVFHNPDVDMLGCAFVSVATVLSAGHFVLAAAIMSDNGVEPLSLMLLITVPVVLVLVPLFQVTEGWARVASEFNHPDKARELLWTLALASGFAFVHSLLAWYLIRFTSPVYCTVLMCVKVPLLVAVTVPLFGVSLPLLNWAGIVIACGAFAAYECLELRRSVANETVVGAAGTKVLAPERLGNVVKRTRATLGGGTSSELEQLNSLSSQ
jgi:drug/metabolite transporter (DMT)-like permease